MEVGAFSSEKGAFFEEGSFLVSDSSLVVLVSTGVKEVLVAGLTLRRSNASSSSSETKIVAAAIPIVTGRLMVPAEAAVSSAEGLKSLSDSSVNLTGFDRRRQTGLPLTGVEGPSIMSLLLERFEDQGIVIACFGGEGRITSRLQGGRQLGAIARSHRADSHRLLQYGLKTAKESQEPETSTREWQSSTKC